ncbi:MAG: T9SS type A sorting domain-containing protein [Chitinophagaceae bacterium]|nr:T9SS type A sorting domain-containing protein [Chitinophagaceae bacterium]
MKCNFNKIIILCLAGLTWLNHACAQWSVSAEKDDSVCLVSGGQFDLQMISDLHGGAFIAWHDWRSILKPEIYSQWIDKNGIPRWTTNGINITPVSNPGNNQFELRNDSAGGLFLIYTEYGWTNYIERIDSNGNVLWKCNLDVLLDVSSVNYAVDGYGGIYVLFNNDFYGKAYFTHFNSNGINVTPGGKKVIADVPQYGEAGKIMMFDSSTLIIVTSTENSDELICTVDTSGNIISSSTTFQSDFVNYLQRGVNHCAIFVTSDYSLFPNLKIYRINLDASISVSLIGQDNTNACGYSTSGFTEFFGLVESDTNNLYLAYRFSCYGNFKTIRFNEAGTDFQITPLNSFYTQCADGSGGIYSALGNRIYHFKNTDSITYSDTITYSNLGYITGFPKIISDGSNGCLISFTKYPDCSYDTSDDGVFAKRYPETGISETSLPVINCLFASGVCFSGNMSLTAGCSSTNVEFYWYHNGQLIDPSSTNKFYFTLTDFDSIEYFQCITTNILGSDTSSILSYPMYPLPDITYPDDTLWAYEWGAISYQWYQNNSSVGLYSAANAISGAIHAYYIPGSTGYYGCRVFVPNGCFGYGLPFYVSSTSVTAISPGKNIRAYPIPTDGKLTIELPDEGSNIQLITITGKILREETTNAKTITFDLSDFPDGFYFIRIIFSNSSEIIKVEKKK